VYNEFGQPLFDRAARVQQNIRKTGRHKPIHAIQTGTDNRVELVIVELLVE